MFTRKLFTVLGLAAALLSITLLFERESALAASKTFLVISTADSHDTNPGDGKCKSTTGACTLRAAIEEANSDPGQDVIYLKSGTTYPLTSQLVILGSLILFGGGHNDGGILADGGSHRAFEIMPGASVGIADLVIRGGNQSQGGGILNHGSLQLARVYFLENHATADGGGLYNDDFTWLTDVKFEKNTAANSGGAIYNEGTLKVETTTLWDNEATTQLGGGLYNDSLGQATLINSTVSGNRAGGRGGGIYNGINATLDTYNVTIAKNTANLQKNGSDGGGAYNFGGTFTLRHTLIADNANASVANFVSDDCGGTMTFALGNYVESGNSCTFVGGGAAGQDPDLAPLGYNYGLTPTHSFESASGAVDSGANGACASPDGQYLLKDQRGFVRVADGNGNGSANCDMGALEFNAPNPCAGKPAKPFISSPGDGISTSKRVLLLSWNLTECATYYRVVIRQDNKKGPVVLPKQTLGATHFITAKLPKNHTYFWKVQACNGFGCGKGKSQTFQVN